MPYKFLPHTSETRALVSGRTLTELFTSALAALTKSMAPKLTGRKTASRRVVRLTAPDTTALLIEFLNGVLAFMNIHKEAYAEVVFKNLTLASLTAELVGKKVDLFKNDVKAVTYHGAKVAKGENVWTTEIIFDV